MARWAALAALMVESAAAYSAEAASRGLDSPASSTRLNTTGTACLPRSERAAIRMKANHTACFDILEFALEMRLPGLSGAGGPLSSIQNALWAPHRTAASAFAASEATAYL